MQRGEKKTKLLVIVGPTASGKSALSVELARELDGEVISADSRQVYRGLDIGTGKITKKETRGVPHHLLDATSPKRVFTASDFVTKARHAIEVIERNGKLPILCGGTGFYIDALVGRISLPDVQPDPRFRKSVNNFAAAKLFTLLKKLDPKRAKMLSSDSERNNRVRLIRAIEIARANKGEKRPTKEKPRYDTLWIGLKPSDEELRKKIDTRLSYRLSHGMIAEAKRLHKRGLSYKRMETLGLEYRSLARFLQKKITRAELESELRSDIWRYARKQIGYWKRNKEIEWFDPNDKHIPKLVSNWLRGK